MIIAPTLTLFPSSVNKLSSDGVTPSSHPVTQHPFSLSIMCKCHFHFTYLGSDNKVDFFSFPLSIMAEKIMKIMFCIT